MRTQARALITVATLGVLAASYQFGYTAETGLILGMPAATAAPVTSPPTEAPVTSPPTEAPAATPTKAPVAAATTKTGTAIDYKYGTVQLEVTKASGIITDVNVLVGFGSEPKYTDLIASLAQYAVAANGSDFANVSRATFSTTAFKQALDSALAKF